LRGEEAHARRGVTKRLLERAARGRDLDRSQAVRGLRAHFGVRVGEQLDEGRGDLRASLVGAPELGQSPHGVQPRERSRGLVVGELGEHSDALRAARCELELRFEARPTVGVREKADQLGVLALLEARGKDFRELGADARGFRVRLLGRDAVHAALAGLRPAVDPIGDPELAVGTERHVRGQHAAHELLTARRHERRAVFLERVGLDAAARDASLEVRDEEMALVLRFEAGARVVRQAGGAVLDVAHRGE
jgi:hypothetical protein